MDVERPRVTEVVGSPDPVDERLAGEHAAGVLHQQLEELEFLARQVDGLSPDGDLEPLRVEPDTPGFENLPFICRFPPGSSQNGPDPGNELSGAERLGDIVIGPELQSDNLVDLGVASGEHDDRHVRRTTDLLADVLSWKAGEHEVKQHQVGSIGLEPSETFATVGHPLHLVALATKGVLERFTESGLVFDEENP